MTLTNKKRENPAKNWVFTVNNYTTEDEESLKKIPANYLLYGKEIGEKGTPHLQGYIQLEKKTRRRCLTKYIKCFWEVAKGSIDDNIRYCRKDKQHVEIGIPLRTQGKGSAASSRELKIARNALLVQRDLNELVINGDITMKESKAVSNAKKVLIEESNRKRKHERIDGEFPNKWYHGKSGTGKSYIARHDHPDAFDKPCNKWWDGYNNEDVVIIDDLDKRHEGLIHHLKRWTDRYSFPAEIKGGTLGLIRPKIIIITSNYTPSDIWPQSQDYEPMERRCELVEFVTTDISMKQAQKRSRCITINIPKMNTITS
jgi:hypothetical protein